MQVCFQKETIKEKEQKQDDEEWKEEFEDKGRKKAMMNVNKMKYGTVYYAKKNSKKRE